MVSYTEILSSNAQLTESTCPSVSVFVGGTSGIGQLTIKALVKTGLSLRIYMIGRTSAATRTREFIASMRAVNDKAELIWLEGEVSLLSEVARLSALILSKEPRVDLLFLTTGYAPFRSVREETEEGIEITQVLGYYARVFFAILLRPALSRAEGRVVSVFGGGMEFAGIDLDDLELKREENFGQMKTHMHNSAMGTMMFEKLACGDISGNGSDGAEGAGVTFIHSCPGWVNTGNVWRGLDQNSGSFMGWFVWLVLNPLIGLFSFSDEESAQRHLYMATSAAFGGKGVDWKNGCGVNSKGVNENGLFLVGWKCDCTRNERVVSNLRDKAQQKIWDHTMEVLRPYL